MLIDGHSGSTRLLAQVDSCYRKINAVDLISEVVKLLDR